MTRKKKPPTKGGNQNTIHSGNYSNTSDHKQRLIRKFPIIRLYAPIYPADAPDGGIHDVNDLVNYARRKAEGGDTDE
ncbi:hypothetical protein [Thiothrix subterranea]|uniref:Uncharacterized protein n=1 Tax=Thiothrix subterranea TaxID=2735563 RepID=A0AA51MLZ2_9GAMM|nr:hypothetical protein [Thiothrix subterranea]MDQ5770475.1 hypothetical protein [Thiothrix subterranea]WML86847.1 hypothetical protein RCG00_21515 [Thiothrix subterranea]